MSAQIPVGMGGGCLLTELYELTDVEVDRVSEAMSLLYLVGHERRYRPNDRRLDEAEARAVSEVRAVDRVMRRRAAAELRSWPPYVIPREIPDPSGD